MVSPSLRASVSPQTVQRFASRWRRWWRGLAPHRQDRFAALAPLVAVFLFFLAIVASFWYLHSEEVERERDALRRDTEYAQQRLRLRLTERQEQVLRIARELSTRSMGEADFAVQADLLIAQYPEVQALTWIDATGRIRMSQAAPNLASGQLRMAGEMLHLGSTAHSFREMQRLEQPAYLPIQTANDDATPLLALMVPLASKGRFTGALLTEYSFDSLLRYGTPTEVLARYAVTLLTKNHQLLAGTPLVQRSRSLLPWSDAANADEAVLELPGQSLVLRAQAYRTSLGVVGSSLFWLVGMLSVMTAWLLLGTWRHTRRRLQTQEALIAETNFRRAMENSILTGMRALDLHGQITYVNAAFCQMTGWSAEELVGQTPPYSYWPEAERNAQQSKLSEELSGEAAPGGFQVRVQRKSGTIFDARLYVSALIDGHGRHTGWMTSMTDITEPNRVREQLVASHERFTIVMESLDASVSVAPLGSKELLFANRLYRQWFGSQTEGHLQLVAQAGMAHTEAAGDEDDFMGLPSHTMTTAQSDNVEIYQPDLGKWLEVRSRYLHWVDGRLAQMVIATDITARRRAQEIAAHQAERTQSVSRLITMGEMASSVAHELNQPLTAISNYCSGMISRLESQQISEEALRGALEKTAHQAQRAGQIIQRIRAFVKKSAPNRQLAQVPDMVAEAIELATIELRRHNVRLTHYVAARLPPVMADRILIEQVLINLMKNGAEAIAHAGRPTGRRSVELRVVPRQVEGADVIQFSVEDTGLGLPTDVLEHLFEAFYSTKSEGMGMGLNLCRSIVESHQGRLQAQNLYNGNEITGCLFTFWLPLASIEGATTEFEASTT